MAPHANARKACTECGQELRCDKLYSHVLKTRHMNAITCHMCQKVFRTPRGMQTHSELNQHHLSKVAAAAATAASHTQPSPASASPKTAYVSGGIYALPSSPVALPSRQKAPLTPPALVVGTSAAPSSSPRPPRPRRQKHQHRETPRIVGPIIQLPPGRPINPLPTARPLRPQTSTTMDKDPASSSCRRPPGRPHHRRQQSPPPPSVTDPSTLGWVSPAYPEDALSHLLFKELLSTEERDSRDFPRAGPLNMTLPDRGAAGHSTKKRKALVIDCEMVGVKPLHPGGPQISELVRLAVVDFFTGEVVLDHLVQPTGRVVDWRIKWSGVTPKILFNAEQDPTITVLRGWPEAQVKISEIADQDTFLIGHALENDLRVLHIATDKIVDSVFISAHAVFGPAGSNGGFKRSWSLKTLCKELLDLNIQKKSRTGHSCVEDALATRELILWCLLTNPEDLKTWGEEARAKYEAERLAHIEKQREQNAKAEAERRRKCEEQEAMIKRAEELFAKAQDARDIGEAVFYYEQAAGLAKKALDVGGLVDTITFRLRLMVLEYPKKLRTANGPRA